MGLCLVGTILRMLPLILLNLAMASFLKSISHSVSKATDVNYCLVENSKKSLIEKYFTNIAKFDGKSKFIKTRTGEKPSTQ